MKFLIDENITPELATIFNERNLSAFHINDLKSKKTQRVSDDQLRRLAIQKEYIIVTKDDDFVKSFVSRKVPEKMIFLYELNNKNVLLERMKQIINLLPDWIQNHDFIEVKRKEVRFPFS